MPAESAITLYCECICAREDEREGRCMPINSDIDLFVIAISRNCAEYVGVEVIVGNKGPGQGTIRADEFRYRLLRCV
jgi:hypothetical protein